MKNSEPYYICHPPFINVQPLVYHLYNYSCKHIVIDSVLPGEISVDCFNRYNAILMSSCFSLENDDIHYYKNIGICSDRTVYSVALFSKVPLEDISTVSLTTQSQTSIRLCQILFNEYINKNVAFRIRPGTVSENLRYTDAALLIGDKCISERVSKNSEKYYIYDLGELWNKYTDLPFVWALWQYKTYDEKLYQILSEAKEIGTSKVDLFSNMMNNYFRNNDNADNYFRHNLHYTLGEREERAIGLFKNLIEKHYLKLVMPSKIAKSNTAEEEKTVVL